MDAGAALVLFLAAGLDSSAAVTTAGRGAAAPDSQRVAASPSPSPRVLAGLSRLALEKVRVRVDGAAYVLRVPRFAPDGIGWRSADGFPRRPPALVSGADWDSVPAPSNPLRWREGMHLEAVSDQPGGGAAFGAVLGGAGGGLLAGLYAGWGSQSLEIGYLGLLVGAIGGGWLGYRLGHALLDVGSRWEPIAGASPVPLASARADGPGAAWDSGLASGAPGVPDALTLAGLAARAPGHVRVHARGRRDELVGPRFGADGLDYRHAVGFPRARPALFAGADWDSVPPPPRPIPWESIERIERRRRDIGVGTLLGGVAGACLGYWFTAAVLTESRASAGQNQLFEWSGGLAGGVLGAALGRGFFDPAERWETIYPPEAR